MGTGNDATVYPFPWSFRQRYESLITLTQNSERPLEQVRKSVLNFLPDAYITEILDKEVKKGLFEKIELAVPNAKSTQFVYKSKSNSNKMNTSRIDLD